MTNRKRRERKKEKEIKRKFLLVEDAERTRDSLCLNSRQRKVFNMRLGLHDDTYPRVSDGDTYSIQQMSARLNVSYWTIAKDITNINKMLDAVGSVFKI